MSACGCDASPMEPRPSSDGDAGAPAGAEYTLRLGEASRGTAASNVSAGKEGCEGVLGWDSVTGYGASEGINGTEPLSVPEWPSVGLPLGLGSGKDWLERTAKEPAGGACGEGASVSLGRGGSEGGALAATCSASAAFHRARGSTDPSHWGSKGNCNGGRAGAVAGVWG